MTYSKNLLQFSVVLAADVNNPSVLNPDFLRHNGIVDQSWGVNPSSVVVTTPAFSRVEYDNKFFIQSDHSRVVFTTENASIAGEVCPIVTRYVKNLPHVTYSAIGINPAFLLPAEDPSNTIIKMASPDDDQWMMFKDIKPELQLGVSYTFDQRIINLSVKRHGESSSSSGILFKANVHRNLNAESDKVGKIASILEGWEGDLLDVNQLINKILPGGSGDA